MSIISLSNALLVNNQEITNQITTAFICHLLLNIREAYDIY